MVAICPGATETGLYSSAMAMDCSFPALNQMEQLVQNMPLQKYVIIKTVLIEIQSY